MVTTALPPGERSPGELAEAGATAAVAGGCITGGEDGTAGAAAEGAAGTGI